MTLFIERHCWRGWEKLEKRRRKQWKKAKREKRTEVIEERTDSYTINYEDFVPVRFDVSQESYHRKYLVYLNMVIW